MILDSRIKLRHLSCFVETALQQSVSRAADKLSITQPAVSKTIRELEEIVGVRLLARTKTGIKLTTDGEVFHRHAATGLAALRQGMESIQHLQGTPQVVSIGVLPNVAATIMPKAIAAFKAEYPNAKVRIDTGPNATLLSLLRLSDLDMVVGRLAEPDQMIDLSFEHLYSERITIVVRPDHPITREQPFTLAQIGNYLVILPTTSTIIRHEVDRYLMSQGIGFFPNTIETLSPTFGRAFTLGYDAIWFTPRGIVEGNLSEGLLRELLIGPDAMRGPVGLTLRSQTEPPALVRHLAHVIRQSASELRAGTGL